MDNVLKLAGWAGGTVGGVAAFPIFFFVPEICRASPSGITGLVLGYNCFGLGVFLNRPGFDGDSAALIQAAGIAGC